MKIQVRFDLHELNRTMKKIISKLLKKVDKQIVMCYFILCKA